MVPVPCHGLQLCHKDGETPIYLDDIGDDLPPLVVPVPSHGLRLCHKDRETPFYLDDVSDDLPSFVVPVPSHGLRLCLHLCQKNRTLGTQS